MNSTPKELPIKHIVPEDLPIVFSDQMVVRHQNGMFIVMFFQNRNPVALTVEDAQKVTEVQSQCVAQLVMAPEQMGRNIAALTQNYQQFVESQATARPIVNEYAKLH